MYLVNKNQNQNLIEKFYENLIVRPLIKEIQIYIEFSKLVKNYNEFILLDANIFGSHLNEDENNEYYIQKIIINFSEYENPIIFLSDADVTDFILDLISRTHKFKIHSRDFGSFLKINTKKQAVDIEYLNNIECVEFIDEYLFTVFYLSKYFNLKNPIVKFLINKRDEIQNKHHLNELLTQFTSLFSYRMSNNNLDQINVILTEFNRFFSTDFQITKKNFPNHIFKD